MAAVNGFYPQHVPAMQPLDPAVLEHLDADEPLPVELPPPAPLAFAPSKPKLVRPELLIMALDKKLKALSKRTMNISLTKIEKENLTLEKLIMQQISTDTDLADSKNEAFIWSMLKNIGSCIMAVFQMVFGSYLISTGGGAGAGSALIASGMLALANAALSESGGWNWIAACMEEDNAEKQEMIAIILPLVVATLSIGLSIAGFAGAMEVENVDELLELMNQGIQILTGGAHLGAAYGEYQVVTTQIQALGFEKGMTLSEKHIDLFSRAFEELMREFDRVSSTVKKMIKQSIHESRAVTMA